MQIRKTKLINYTIFKTNHVVYEFRVSIVFPLVSRGNHSRDRWFVGPTGLFHDGFGLNTPLLLCETAVVVVAPFCISLSGGEEFGSFCGILLHH